MNFVKEDRRMLAIAAAVVLLDQGTKLFVLNWLGLAQEKVVVPGFFRFVHWENSGAAWSLFHDRNGVLAVVSAAALAALFVARRRFHADTAAGRAALGLVLGGIAGNLIDRVHYHQVIDFLRFYLIQHSGQEVGFPAFNVADSAICTGVGLLVLVSFWAEQNGRADARKSKEPGPAAPVRTGP